MPRIRDAALRRSTVGGSHTNHCCGLPLGSRAAPVSLLRLAVAASQLLACCRPAAATECCHGAEPLITKFAQVDHAPRPEDEALASMPFGQRALEIFNPSCEAIDLAEYEIVVTNPLASAEGKDPITRVSLNPGAHAGGRGHGDGGGGGNRRG